MMGNFSLWICVILYVGIDNIDDPLVQNDFVSDTADSPFSTHILYYHGKYPVFGQYRAFL